MMSARRLLDWHLGCCRPCPHIASRHVPSRRRISDTPLPLLEMCPQSRCRPGSRSPAKVRVVSDRESSWQVLRRFTRVRKGTASTVWSGVQCLCCVLSSAKEVMMTPVSLPLPPPPPPTHTPRADCAYIPLSPVLPRVNQ